MAQVVAQSTGLSQAYAEKRVSEVVTQAKVTADKARKGAVKLSLWLTAEILANIRARHVDRPPDAVVDANSGSHLPATFGAAAASIRAIFHLTDPLTIRCTMCADLLAQKRQVRL